MSNQFQLPVEKLMRAASRNRGLFWCGCAAIVTAILAVVLLRGSEPSYEGKTLTQWLYVHDPDFSWMPNDFYGHIHNELWEKVIAGGYGAASVEQVASQPAGEPDPATVAVQKMGTNTIPYLLRFIAARPTRGERLWNWVRPRVPAKLGQFISKSRLPRTAALYHYAALQGFCALGSNAVSALPALSRLLERPEADFELGFSIEAAGPEGRQVLVKALGNQESSSRGVAAFCLGEDPTAAVEVISPLVSLVDHGHGEYHVLGAIGKLGGPAELVVPALTQFLRRPEALAGRQLESAMAILILGLYGEQARSSIPVLLGLYPGADKTTRQAIRVVLKHIQPDQAGQLLKRTPSKEDDEDPWWNGAKD